MLRVMFAALLLAIVAIPAARADQYLTNGSIACRDEKSLAALYNALQSHNETTIRSLAGKDKPCRQTQVGSNVTILKGGLYVSEVRIADLNGVFFMANAGIQVTTQTPRAK